MPKVKINEINIYYEIQGQGPPLILIAGLGCASWLWFKQIPEFSKMFKIIVFDNRGVGQTDKPDIPYSIKLFAEDTIGLLSALDIQQAHVLGISMGGLIAQQMALEFPSIINKLILCATTHGGPHALPIPQKIIDSMVENSRLAPELVYRKNMALTFTANFPESHKEDFDYIINQLLINRQPAYAYQRQLMTFWNFNVEHRLNQIHCTTLIMSGDQDQIIPVKNSQLLHNKIPGSKLEIIENAGHLFNVEKAAAFNQKVMDFLSSK